jgi:hypothetical protein
MRRGRGVPALLALALIFGGVACEASGEIDDEGGNIDVDVGENGGEGGG